MSRTHGETRDCHGCRFWSEMIAMATARGVEAMCLGGDDSKRGQYTVGTQTCAGWKSGHLGAVDDPPDYGETTRALYEMEEAR